MKNVLKVFISSTCLLMSSAAFAVCTAYCKPGVSRACGGGCISIYKHCRKPTTTACNGIRPATATKSYANPKKVEPKPFTESKQTETDEKGE